ncbi:MULTISPECIES: hypothetical protein [unclassified Streptomyces]|uniref:hypothetical protein n=1 Tax=unclassified Streptomyces TaxID=2593676 RepID=UPI003870AB2B
MVVNELKPAPYQFVSPAKYLAALRSMSSWAASLRSLASSSAIRERAVAEDWRGEIDGLDLTLTFLRSKREQARRFQRSGQVSLGLPVVPHQKSQLTGG